MWRGQCGVRPQLGEDSGGVPSRPFGFPSRLGCCQSLCFRLQVAVVKMKQTGQVYAMKIMNKWDMLKRGEVRAWAMCGGGRGYRICSPGP